jgi:hypothetical protein
VSIRNALKLTAKDAHNLIVKKVHGDKWGCWECWESSGCGCGRCRGGLASNESQGGKDHEGRKSGAGHYGNKLPKEQKEKNLEDIKRWGDGDDEG